MALNSVVHMLPITKRILDMDRQVYEHREYPKMMLMLADQAYVDAWMERNENTDERTGKKTYKGGRPRLGQLVPVLNDVAETMMVHDEDEEEAFYAEHPEAVRSAVPVDPKLKALEDKNAALQAQIDALKAGGSNAKPAAEAKINTPVATASAAVQKPGAKAKAKTKANLPKDL